MILARDSEEFIGLLNKHAVEYLVVGGYAFAFHGRPRHTGRQGAAVSGAALNC